MTKNTNSTSDTEKTSPQPAKPTKTPVGRSSAELYPRLLIGAAVLLSLFASVGVVYLIYQLSGMYRGINQEIEMSNTTIASLVEEQKNLNQFIQENQSRVKKNKRKWEKEFSELEKRIAHSLQEKGFQAEDWQLLKARYFLEMAQINAHWQQDPDITLAMLKQADALLKPFKNKTVFTIRQDLAKNINALQNLQTPDTVGLLSQLDALRQQIQALDVSKPALPKPTETESPPADTQRKAWKERWADSVHLLEKLVVIRHYQNGALSIVPPAQQEILKESIVLSLQQAQWAVMQKNQRLFQRALKDGINQLQRLSLQDQEAINRFKTQLQELSQVSLTVAQPDPAAALEQLNTFIDEQTPQASIPMTSTKEDAS